MKTILITLFILSSFITTGQRQRDTIPVIMLVTDTSRYRKVVQYIDELLIHWDTIIYKYNTDMVEWEKGYSVREKHNSGEGVLDAWSNWCVDKSGKRVSCYHDYWQHLFYLDKDKKPINENYIIWDSKDIN